jgi:hypothetical protein
VNTDNDDLGARVSELRQVKKLTHVSGPHGGVSCTNWVCLTGTKVIRRAEEYIARDRSAAELFEDPLFAAKYQDMSVLKSKINDTVVGRFEAVKLAYEIDDHEGIREKFTDFDKAISLHLNFLAQLNRKAIETMYSVDLDTLARQVALASELTY